MNQKDVQSRIKQFLNFYNRNDPPPKKKKNSNIAQMNTYFKKVENGIT